MALSAFQYHQRTSYNRQAMDGRPLDWAAQPNVYKTYPGLEPLPLPREIRLPEIPLFDLLGQGPAADRKAKITPLDLSALFLLTHSLTAKARHPGGDFFYRAAASAGALYPTEIYTALSGSDGLADGLYHFSIARHGLVRIRSGKLTALSGPAGPGPADSAPGLIFFLTAIFFRSSWKYRDRAFRYHLLDTGHVLEHLALALKALSLPYRLTFDFDDRGLSILLGLDENKETPLVCCPANAPTDLPNFEPVVPLPALYREAGRVAVREVDYPLIREACQSGLTIRSETPADFNMVRQLGPEPDSWIRLADQPATPEKMPFGQTVFSRRSRRNFIPSALSRESWQALWEALACFDEKEGLAEFQPRQLLGVGCLAGPVAGVQPGFFLLDWSSKSIGLAAAGSFTRPMAGICLDQAWLAQAAVHFCFLTNLRLLDAQRGPRGYRYAMMLAGRLGERLYLAATALGLGCCGIGALYDQEAADLLGLNQDSRLLYLAAVGPVQSLR